MTWHWMAHLHTQIYSLHMPVWIMFNRVQLHLICNVQENAHICWHQHCWVPKTSADVITTARFSLRPAAATPGSQTGVCGDDKVSQTPSGGWSDFDTRPITQPRQPHTQMGNISGQIASGRTTSFNNIFNIFRGLFNKTDGVFFGANNDAFDNARRSAACWGIFRSLPWPLADQSLEGELMDNRLCAGNTGGFAIVI